MSQIIDCHAHVLPDPLAQLVTKINPNHGVRELLDKRLSQLRRQARGWLTPVSSSLHHMQTLIRYLPDSARRSLDRISTVVPLPSLLVESTPADLKEAMDAAKVQRALIIAHPPVSSNEFVLEVCQNNQALIPVVRILPGAQPLRGQLKKYVKQGAKALKIHPSADGKGASAREYKTLLREAADLFLPVIVHTGCVHAPLYKDPDQSEAAKFNSWFKTYPQIKFILAHMNFHTPDHAIDLAEEYQNVYVDTSWQPAEIIGEAHRRLGAEKILFGSDWPFIGHNLTIGINRIYECVNAGTITQTSASQILGGNALRIFGEPHATST